MKKITTTLLLFVIVISTLSAQIILNPNDALNAFYKNFDKIKSGTFKITRTETVASFPPKIYKSSVEFDATSISSDSVVRHLISIGDSEQVYCFHDTLYHLYHQSKQCYIRPITKINFAIALGYERLYDFMPYVSKESNRFYNIKTWQHQDFNSFRFSEVIYDSLYSHLRFYSGLENEMYAGGSAIDMKLNASLSQVISITYTNIDNYFTTLTTLEISPVKEASNQLNTFDISYYLKHYRVEIIMPDQYFHRN